MTRSRLTAFYVIIFRLVELLEKYLLVYKYNCKQQPCDSWPLKHMHTIEEQVLACQPDDFNP